MLLYVLISLWIFILMLVGLRSYPSNEPVLCLESSEGEGTVYPSRSRAVGFFVGLTLLFLWILTAFRSENIGNDTQNYIYYFKDYAEKGMDPSRRFEMGYQWLSVTIAAITDDPHVFLIIIASILYVGMSICMYKNSKNLLVSLCLFFCICFSLFASMFRQGIAMMIVMFGYYQLKKGNKIKAAAIFLVAMLFHQTAIICFALFLNTKLFKKKWLVLGISAVISVLAISGILNSVLVSIIPQYAHYFKGQYVSSGWLAVSYELVRNLVFYLIACKAVNEDDRSSRLGLTNMSMLLLCGTFGYVVNLFTRAGQYFLLIAICEIPNLLYSENIKRKKILTFSICSVMLLMFILILIFRPSWNHLYPYEFWSYN